MMQKASQSVNKILVGWFKLAHQGEMWIPRDGLDTGPKKSWSIVVISRSMLTGTKHGLDRFLLVEKLKDVQLFYLRRWRNLLFYIVDLLFLTYRHTRSLFVYDLPLLFSYIINSRTISPWRFTVSFWALLCVIWLVSFLFFLAAASCAVLQTKMNINVERIRWIRHMVISIGREKREILCDEHNNFNETPPICLEMNACRVIFQIYPSLGSWISKKKL